MPRASAKPCWARPTWCTCGAARCCSARAIRCRRGRAAFYGLAAGTIKISTLREDGQEAILAVLEPGNWFGEITPDRRSPRTHDATALGALDVLVVPPEAFAQQMQGQAFSHAIAALLAARVRGLYGLMEDATLRVHARPRRAPAAAAGARRRDAVGAMRAPVVPVPQEALAMMLGVTRQTLSKELNALAEERVIALGYGRIELLSLDALQRLGGMRLAEHPPVRRDADQVDACAPDRAGPGAG